MKSDDLAREIWQAVEEWRRVEMSDLEPRHLRREREKWYLKWSSAIVEHLGKLRKGDECERCAKIAEAYAAEQPMNHNLDDGAAIARRFAALEIARRIRK